MSRLYLVFAASLSACLFGCVRKTEPTGRNIADAPAPDPATATAALTIAIPEDASSLETLAAREIARYVYLRTGSLLPITACGEVGSTTLSPPRGTPPAGEAIIVARRDRPVVRSLSSHGTIGDGAVGATTLSPPAAEALGSSIARLGAEGYVVKTLKLPGRRVILVAGADDVGTLYGAYRFVEHLGVRFYLHGDVVPDVRMPPLRIAALPELDERAEPLFRLRGIQPFHDFPEGPDWWDLDDYEAVISQLPKLRMNFIGLHTYPEGGVGPEPTVWIGPAEDVGEDGRVKRSYPSSYMNTLRGNWGYAPKKTGEFVFGAAELFERDAYGSDLMLGMCPQPATSEACNEVFRRAGTLLRGAFEHARSLGVKTCVGTETPLTVPKLVRERLASPGKRSWTPLGGKPARYDSPIAGTDDDTLYQTVRWDLAGYRFSLPDGRYAVTLKFCEVAYGREGARVFGVKLQGRNVIDRLDIFGKVGKNRALDFTFEDVEVTDGKLEIGFVRRVEHPCIAAISVVKADLKADLKAEEGEDYTVEVNCSGPAYKGYAPDDGSSSLTRRALTPSDVQKLYEGMFLRIMKTYPVDYYWLWTPEGWTWSGADEAQVAATVADLRTAVEAAASVKAPFTLATCGWVLGPPGNRALFDEILPKEMPLSCISRQVGRSPVEKDFRKIAGRPKWSIPWLEDDPAMTSPQLWVGRMRKDAADSLEYGCTGLVGIHWRTRILGPNVSALARAAWDQSEWNRPEAEEARPPREDGPVGGRFASFPNSRISDTEDDPLYRTVRYNVSAYHLRLPDGKYTVTLKFCEPHYGEAGKRVFGVKVQGEEAIGGLDVFAEVGKNRALDYTFDDIAVTDGWLDIEFTDHTEFPCIAAISVEGAAATRKINCGGPKYAGYDADWPASEAGAAPGRFSPAADFYRDWALSQFGPEVAPEAAALFVRLDGKLPRPSDWVGGPGGLKPDGRPWEEVRGAFAFVEEMAALRPKVEGAGNLERFDYWLGNFRAMRSTARVKCVWARFNGVMAGAAAEKDPEARKRLAREAALPLRKELVGLVAEVYRHLLPTLSSPGGMGTIANWEQHILPGLLRAPGRKLAEALGEPLPADALPSRRYAGPPRVIVPTVRTSVSAGESLKLKVIVLAAEDPGEMAIHWRPFGQPRFDRAPLTHLARGVYSATLPPMEANVLGLEYYVEVAFGADSSGDGISRFPATAPALNQTVVVVPRAD